MTPLEMIAEWRKGCSCASHGKPEECQECTRGLIDALERNLRNEDVAIVVNQAAPADLVVGDYVFASRWSDCDHSDPWAVGHVSEVGPNFVVVGDVCERRWTKAMRITSEQGEQIVANYPALEKDETPLDYKKIASIFGVKPESLAPNKNTV